MILLINNLMKKLYTIAMLFFAISGIRAQNIVNDSITREQFVHSQTVKADTLNMMAMKLATPDAGKDDLNKAIDLIMKGIHTYSRFRDSVGLRQTFEHLAIVYHLQKKHIQAKWFYIQSNTYARELKDTANIINTLIGLSTVKTEMKDPDLAEGDLKEALSLAKQQHNVDEQIRVGIALVALYTKMGRVTKADQTTLRISFLNDSVKKAAESQKLAQDKLKANNLHGQLTQKPVVQPQTDHSILIIISIIAIVIVLLLVIYFKRSRS